MHLATGCGEQPTPVAGLPESTAGSVGTAPDSHCAVAKEERENVECGSNASHLKGAAMCDDARDGNDEPTAHRHVPFCEHHPDYAAPAAADRAESSLTPAGGPNTDGCLAVLSRDDMKLSEGHAVDAHFALGLHEHLESEGHHCPRYHRLRVDDDDDHRHDLGQDHVHEEHEHLYDDEHTLLTFHHHCFGDQQFARCHDDVGAEAATGANEACLHAHEHARAHVHDTLYTGPCVSHDHREHYHAQCREDDHLHEDFHHQLEHPYDAAHHHHHHIHALPFEHAEAPSRDDLQKWSVADALIDSGAFTTQPLNVRERAPSASVLQDECSGHLHAPAVQGPVDRPAAAPALRNEGNSASARKSVDAVPAVSSVGELASRGADEQPRSVFDGGSGSSESCNEKLIVSAPGRSLSLHSSSGSGLEAESRSAARFAVIRKRGQSIALGRRAALNARKLREDARAQMARAREEGATLQAAPVSMHGTAGKPATAVPLNSSGQLVPQPRLAGCNPGGSVAAPVDEGSATIRANVSQTKVKRAHRVKWRQSEIAALHRGVAKHGVGRWAVILREFAGDFDPSRYADILRTRCIFSDHPEACTVSNW
jgi:hypothetical protein